MNGPIDFAEINRAALAAFPAVLSALLPGGKASARKSSRSIRAAPIAGLDRSRSTGTTGIGATSPRGTKAAILFPWLPISQASHKARRPGCSPGCLGSKPEGCAMADGLRSSGLVTTDELAKRRRHESARCGERDAEANLPPASAEAGADAAARCTAACLMRLWRYAMRKAQRRFYVCRWNKPDGDKEVRPLSWFASERLATSGLGQIIGRLFNLPDRNRETPTRRLSSAEGEKAADAAAAIFPNCVATTSSGGAQRGDEYRLDAAGRPVACSISPDQ